MRTDFVVRTWQASTRESKLPTLLSSTYAATKTTLQNDKMFTESFTLSSHSSHSSTTSCSYTLHYCKIAHCMLRKGSSVPITSPLSQSPPCVMCGSLTLPVSVHWNMPLVRQGDFPSDHHIAENATKAWLIHKAEKKWYPCVKIRTTLGEATTFLVLPFFFFYF